LFGLAGALLVLAVVFTSLVAGLDHGTGDFFVGSKITRRAQGDRAAQARSGSSEPAIVEISTSVGSVFLPPGSLPRATLVRVARISIVDDLPPGFRLINGIEVDLGGVQPQSPIVVAVDGSADAVMLHKVGERWEYVGTSYVGGRLFALANSASPFVTAESTNSVSGDASLSKHGCYVAAFTGWSLQLDELATNVVRGTLERNRKRIVTAIKDVAFKEYDSQPDNEESAAEKLEINRMSAIGRALTDAWTAGLNLEWRVSRHYDWSSGTQGILDAAKQGRKIVLVGHSAGGAAAIKTAYWLNDHTDVSVALVVALDTYDGLGGRYRWVRWTPWWLTSEERPMPANVEKTLNFYQRNGVKGAGPVRVVEPFYFGREWASAGGSIENIGPIPELTHEELDGLATDERVFRELERICGKRPETPPTDTVVFPPPEDPNPTRNGSGQVGSGIVTATATRTATSRPPLPPVAPPTFTPTPTATPTPRPTQYSMTLTLDGSQYAPGDTMRICYRLSPENVPYHYVLTQSGAGGSRLVREGNDNGVGGGDCFSGQIEQGAPAGPRQFLIEAFVAGQKVAQATADATVVVSQSGWQICEQINFGGRCIDLFPGADVQGDIVDLTSWNFNDMTSSIRAGADTLCLWVYEHTYFGGRELEVRPGQSIPDLTVFGFNDAISSVEFSGCTSGGSGPTGGACERAPSAPTNFRLLPGTTTLTWEVTDPGGPGCILQYEVRTFGGQVLYRGSTPSFTLPTINCNSGYFVGAANQSFGIHGFALWPCPNP
jgi:hypothetical protein